MFPDLEVKWPCIRLALSDSLEEYVSQYMDLQPVSMIELTIIKLI